MYFYFAPMEGITGYLFRNIHREMFPGMDRYYMPFIAPHTDGSLKGREKTDTAPGSNPAGDTVPQILSNHAESTIIAAKRLKEQGYPEVNLNFGCPYPTVVTKRKGAGILEDLDRLSAYLDAVFSAPDMPDLSVKTRLRAGAPEESEALIRLYNRFPLKELTIHPRRQQDFYKGTPDLETFKDLTVLNVHSLCYNGNLYTPDDVSGLMKDCSELSALMIGRGLLRNPALVRTIRGGSALTIEELHLFHDRIFEAYCQTLSGPAALLGHMKELWIYWETNLQVSPKLMKQLYKSRTAAAYEAAAGDIFSTASLLDANEQPVRTAKLQL